MSRHDHAPVSSRPRRIPSSIRLLITLCTIGIISFQLSPQAASLQAQADSQTMPGSLIELRTGPEVGRSRVGRPDETRPHTQSPSIATATFIVTYTDFPPAAQTAFQAAVDIWSTQISSSVPIQINATAVGKTIEPVIY